MMKKAPKDTPKPKQPSIQINRNRGGGKKKPDLFARLRNDEHPLDKIIPIDIEFQRKEVENTDDGLDALQTNQSDAQTTSQLDAQLSIQPGAQPTTILDTQVAYELDAEQNQTGRPNLTEPGAQEVSSWTPNPNTTGLPAINNLDALAPKKENRTPKSKEKSDAKTSDNLELDVQLQSEKEKRRVWENNRATDRASLRPNSAILRKFKVFCAEKDLGLTEFFEISGLKFIELDVQAADQPDVLTPLDDRRLKMLYKTKPFIINLYLRYNSIFNELAESGGKKWAARWSPRDDESAVRYNEVPPAIIELGILQTQVQKGFGSSRIQTFKYYTDEIEKVLASGVSDEMLATILQYHRQLWKNQTGREVDLQFLEDKS